MKNKLHMTESEMKRILSLHKERIDKERGIIKEQNEDIEEDVDPGQSTGRIMAGAGGGAALGAGIGSVVPVVGTALGAVMGAGVGALAGWLTTGGGYAERVQKLFKFCRDHRSDLTKPVNSIDRIRDIADNLRAAVSGLGTDEVLIAKNLRKLKTIPDLCKLSQVYNQRYNETLFDALNGDIDQDGEWRDFVWIPLSELTKNTKKIDPSKLKENAKKCGWGSDIDGYKNSGWRCPKDKNVIPNPNPNPSPYPPSPVPGGGGYSFDYEKIMKEINSKCKGTPTPGGGGEEEIQNIEWNVTDVNQPTKDNKVSSETINTIFKN
jgi:hypothetical protein